MIETEVFPRFLSFNCTTVWIACQIFLRKLFFPFCNIGYGGVEPNGSTAGYHCLTELVISDTEDLTEF